MEKVKIIFKNGKAVDAEVNGSCFITDRKPNFPVDLSEVRIESEAGECILAEIEVNEAASVDGRYWFNLRELTEQELRSVKIQADIQYLAMMTDVEL